MSRAGDIVGMLIVLALVAWMTWEFTKGLAL
jgi:hypothetical protein